MGKVEKALVPSFRSFKGTEPIRVGFPLSYAGPIPRILKMIK